MIKNGHFGTPKSKERNINGGGGALAAILTFQVVSAQILEQSWVIPMFR
jgi:hypothetical protein